MGHIASVVSRFRRQDINGDINQDTAGAWRVKDIVYVSIVGTVMIAALLEWILWLSAFLYCLIKVYLKAENTSIRVLAVTMMFLFTILRCIFLPVMMVTLPLPPQVTQQFPRTLVSFLQWFAFFTFAGLLTIPWLFCVFQLVTHSLGRTKRLTQVLDEKSAPKVVIVMPCYKEIPEILIRTVDSLADCEYPSSCIHVFLSFDGDQQDELYLNTIEKLGVPMTLKSYPTSIDLVYHETRVTVSRFPHGGKRHCQKLTFRLIDKIYALYTKHHDNLFVLFIDSDCILDKLCIQNFMYEMELKPGSKHNMLAMTGVITSTTEKNTLITLLQDMEYIHGQLFERAVESGCGAVTCLPGALTILRFTAFRKMAKYYFADKAEQCDDLFDYGKCHLGEDRWLTHLFMIGAKKRYQIQMNTGAFCKTEAVQTFRSLLKQRRRWFLGFITNEACMLTDIRLWKQYPILCLVRFATNTIRTTALLFFIIVIALITTSEMVAQLPVGFIAVSLGLNWLLMLYFGAKLRRYKIMLYPLMFVVNPLFNWLYMVYGVFTAGQRTWGGPRADAGAADDKTTPVAVIEHAKATGDDLNVVPETFKPAVAAVGRQKSLVQPPRQLEGRFASSHDADNTQVLLDEETGLATREHNPGTTKSRRHSLDSSFTDFTSQPTIATPRRIESFPNLDDPLIYSRSWLPVSRSRGRLLESHQEDVENDHAQKRRPRARSIPELSQTDLSASTKWLGSSSPSSQLGSEPSSPFPMPAILNPYAPKFSQKARQDSSSSSSNKPLPLTPTTSGHLHPGKSPSPESVVEMQRIAALPLSPLHSHSRVTAVGEQRPRQESPPAAEVPSPTPVGKKPRNKLRRRSASFNDLPDPLFPMRQGGTSSGTDQWVPALSRGASMSRSGFGPSSQQAPISRSGSGPTSQAQSRGEHGVHGRQRIVHGADLGMRRVPASVPHMNKAQGAGGGR